MSLVTKILGIFGIKQAKTSPYWLNKYKYQSAAMHLLFWTV